MTPINTPYLCGGILFSLILQARKPRTKARNKLKGGSDGLKDTDVMMGLVEVVTGNCFDNAQGSTFSKCTTMFKTCQDYGTTYIPFTDPLVINSFRTLTNKKDPVLLKRITGFIEKFINEKKAEWLVKAILEMLQNDTEIQDNTNFMISATTNITKKDIQSITKVELPFLLLSVLNFILNERADNTKGRATFEAWHEQKSTKSQWVYISNIGNTISSPINVIMSSDSSKSAETIENYTEPVSTKKLTLNIDELNKEDLQYLKQIRKQAKPLLKYCIDTDPTGQYTKLSLSDELSAFNHDWQYEIREISNFTLRSLLNDIMKVFDEYTYYISDKFLRLHHSKNFLWFRNESAEEGQQLREVLRPETIRLRTEMRNLYIRLYPLPEDDTKIENTTIQQQTNIIQNGNTNVNMTNNETLTIKL
ncbi:hypothetical protein [Veillonella montpellierensis]|uniref:hypothetical protein n=1 Tax=Veillonella montpellierensis TaxID=187328 RepID=UPI0004234A90|nr:hypothetical protein [Veillonella montpellierensis]